MSEIFLPSSAAVWVGCVPHAWTASQPASQPQWCKSFHEVQLFGYMENSGMEDKRWLGPLEMYCNAVSVFNST